MTNKYRIAITIVTIWALHINAFAQIEKVTLVSLDSYRIPLGVPAAPIGRIVHPKPLEYQIYRLKKDTAKLFRISKDGLVSLRKRKQVQSNQRQHSFGITIQVGNKTMEVELVKDEFIKNKVIAHRGAWLAAGVMQNSIRSFENAAKMGCEGSEFDVWMSKDSKVILSHDPHIGGLAVEESTADSLYHSTLASGDPVPTLEQFISVAKRQNKTKMVLEIKYSSKGRTIELTDSIVATVHRLKAQGYIEYISFTYNALKRIVELDPTAKVSYLSGDVGLEKLKQDKMAGLDYHHAKYVEDPSLIAKAKSLQLTTNVWTVNDPQDLLKFLKSDVDMITTDKPELLLELLKVKNK